MVRSPVLHHAPYLKKKSAALLSIVSLMVHRASEPNLLLVVSASRQKEGSIRKNAGGCESAKAHMVMMFRG